jgi:hypothetical protein
MAPIKTQSRILLWGRGLMFDDFSFTGARFGAGFSLGIALPYDYYEHVAQQNKMDAESRREYRTPKGVLRVISCHETCERCGIELSRVYIWNGKKLCNKCVGEEQEAWVLISGTPNNPAQTTQIGQLKKGIESLPPGSLPPEFLDLLRRVGTPKATLIIEPKTPEKGHEILRGAWPDKKRMPDSEGLMGKKKKFLKKDGRSAGSRI